MSANDEKMQKVFLDMATKSKAIENLLVDYNSDNKEIIDEAKSNRKRYVFEMDFSSTERCEVVAESEEDAVNLMLSSDFSDDASKSWEEIKSQGGDYELVSVSDEEEMQL